MTKSVMYGLIVLTMVMGQMGCARTVVRKNPDDCDKGLRFYRSKPYLLISPKEGDLNKVEISLQYLPDFAEEYSATVYTGLIGSNNTAITLNDSGVLTTMNVDVDSKASEFVTAVGSLIGNLPKPTAKDTTSPSAMASETKTVVKAYRVPLGYYEAVVSRGPDCEKHLYGWRYVGFAPFNKCPLQGAGLECMDCNSSSLFGLVSENGAMVFKRIDELAFDTITVTSANSKASGDVIQGKLEKSVNDFLTSKSALPIGGIKAEIDNDAKSVTFSSEHPILSTTGVTAIALGGKMQEIVNDLLQGYTAVNNTEIR